MMRRLFTFTFLFIILSAELVNAQYSQNFEQSAGVTDVVNTLRNQCWSITGLSINQGGSAPINGAQSLVSGVSSTQGNRGFITPFMNFTGTDTIRFSYKWYGTNIAFLRWILIKSISQNGQVTLLDSISVNLSVNGTISYVLPLSGINGPNLIFINYRGNGGNGRIGFDDFRFSGNYTYTSGCVDTDLDGVADRRDRDDDNDGIQDYREACGSTAVNFSCLGGTNSSFDPVSDRDADGIVNYRDPDYCALNTAGVCATLDNDLDGVPDFLDLDSDNDGITDAIEANAGITPANYLNGIIASAVGPNGMPNSAENATNSGITAFPVPDSDSDNRPDYVDIDSDNDGIVDLIEAQATFTFVNSIGLDNDHDGIDDAYDGIIGLSGNGLNPVNTDLSDNADYIDTDTDNDGINDRVEAHDADASGIQNGSELAFTASGIDSDSDGLDDNWDLVLGFDSDNGNQQPISFPENAVLNPEPDWRDSFIAVAEICNNFIDDDGDGLTDCQDPDCGSPVFDSVSTTGVSPCLNSQNGSIEFFVQSAIAFSIDSGQTFTASTQFTGLDTGIYYLAAQSTSGCISYFSLNPVNVSGTNCAPVANDDSYNTPEDISLNASSVLNNDNITDGPSLIINTILLTSPLNGIATMQNDGTFSYTPNSGFNGTDLFTYLVCDGFTPQACDTGTVTINVSSVNDTPVIVNEFVNTLINTSVDTNIIVNDVDPDGTLTTQLIPLIGPLHGTVLVSSNGDLTYTPFTGYSGPDTLVLSVCDNGGVCISDTVFIQVNPGNVPPVILNDFYITQENVPLNDNLLLNDIDPDGTLNVLTIPVYGPLSGFAAFNSNGSFIYIPLPGFSGNDTIVVSVCDNSGICLNDTLFIQVTSVNVPPIVLNETFNTSANTSVSGNILLNDVDPDGTLLLTLPQLSGPASGNFTIDAAGNFTYNPNLNFSGTDTVITLVCDNEGICINDTLFIVVAAGNIPPLVLNDTLITNEDTPFNGNVLLNDSDADGTLSLITIPIEQPLHGTVLLNSNGTFTYSPSSNYFGNDTIVVSVCDNSAVCLNDTIFITVNSVNDSPIIQNENQNALAGTPVSGNILINDSDIDGTLICTLPQISGPLNGTLLVNAAGDYTYTPNAGFNGIDTVIVQVCDNDLSCVNDTLFLIVSLVNQLPIVLNESFSTNEDNPFVFNVLNNDSDPDGILTLQTTALSGPAHGTIIALANGDVTYSPILNYNGNDTIIFLVCDNSGACANDTVFLTIIPQPDQPQIISENYIIPVSLPFNDNILANDVDPDGVLSVQLPPLLNPLNGNIVINGVTGDFVYTPNTGFVGFDTVIVLVCSSTGPCVNDTLFIKIEPGANQNPDINSETFNTLPNTAVNGNILLNDSDPDGILFNQVIPLSGPLNGVIVLDTAGNFIYTPNPFFNGIDTILIQVCDTGGICGTDTLFVIVDIPNIPPIILNEILSVVQGQLLSGNVLLNDTDPDGTLTVNPTPVQGSSHGVFTINTAGNFAYNPNAGYTGPDTVIVLVCDNDGACINDTLFIDVLPVNTPPVVVNDTIFGTEDQIIIGNILLNDFDAQSAVTASTTPVSGPFNGTVVINSAGDISYTPGLNFFGTDTIIIPVCDAALSCFNDTVFVVVAPVNDTVIAQNDFYTINENTSLADTLLLNDIDPDGTSLSSSTTTIFGPLNGVILLSADGSFSYLPNINFNGTDTVVVQICDSGFPGPPTCVNDTIIIQIVAVNNAPLVVNDSAFVNEDQVFSGQILTNDTDPEGTLLVTDTISIYGPIHGTFSIDTAGTYTYLPNLNFNGTDTVVISVCDNGLPLPAMCVNDTLILIVSPLNDAPVTLNDVFTLPQDSFMNGNVLLNDLDIELTTLETDTILIYGPLNGTFNIDTAGNFSYIPNTGFYGNDTVIVSVCDNGSPLPQLCSNDTIIFIVTPVASVANAGPDQLICDSITTMQGNFTPVGNGTWTLLNGSGTFADSSLFNTSVNGLSVGQNVFVWSINWTNGITSDTVVITVMSPPQNTNAGTDKIICQFNDTMQASVPSNGIGTWSVLSGSGQFNNVNDPQSLVSSMGIGVNLFLWTVSNGVCPAQTDTVLYQVTQLPSLAVSGGPIEICAQNMQLSAVAPVIGQGWWSVITAGVNVNDTLLPNALVSGLQFGDNYLIWNIRNGACPVSTDTLKITSWQNPTTANAGTDTIVCGEEVTLSAVQPVTGVGFWQILSGTASIDNQVNYNAKANGLSLGVIELVWSVSNGVCPVSYDTLKIERQECPDTVVFIPEGFSPNNDGVNETLVISGVNGKQVSIIVLNRWGAKVFENNNYQNDWAGDELPDASYYYIIKVQGEDKARTGYLTIWR